VLHLW